MQSEAKGELTTHHNPGQKGCWQQTGHWRIFQRRANVDNFAEVNALLRIVLAPLLGVNWDEFIALIGSPPSSIPLEQRLLTIAARRFNAGDKEGLQGGGKLEGVAGPDGDVGAFACRQRAH